MRAVADNLAFSAQHSILQRDGIEPSYGVSGANLVCTCHTEPPEPTYIVQSCQGRHTLDGTKPDSPFVRCWQTSTAASEAQQQFRFPPNQVKHPVDLLPTHEQRR
jgi:hypothetical protein